MDRGLQNQISIATKPLLKRDAEP